MNRIIVASVAAVAMLAGPMAAAKDERTELLAACLAAGHPEARCACMADGLTERLLPADRGPAMAAAAAVLRASTAPRPAGPPSDAEVAAELGTSAAAVARLVERTGSLLLEVGETCTAGLAE